MLAAPPQVITLGGATVKGSGASGASLAKSTDGFEALWNFLQVNIVKDKGHHI